jgi:isoleucyl-tRNA synthetase
MAAAREGAVEFHDDGSVTLGGVTLAADEVEIQATPRPGTAVAEDDGLVMVLDTALTPELRAEGDAREIARAIQDLRREAGLELDDRIELWVDGAPPAVAAHLPAVAADTLAERVSGEVPADAAKATVELEAGVVTIALRRTG